MTISNIKPRKDGKFAVTLSFERDLRNLHKVFSTEQLNELKERLATKAAGKINPEPES